MKITPLAVFAGALVASSGAHADVRLPKIISDHMILQRSQTTRIWGTGDPGEEVTVTLGMKSARTVAGADGKWLVAMDLQDSATGPFEMTVKGKNAITLTDVLVGEVWLASGQSNMEMTLKDTKDAEREIEQSATPQLRQFLIKNNATETPAKDCDGKWVLAGPKTSGGFSAAGYYFIKKLNNELQVPVGLVHCSWGGTPVESWMSFQALESNPELADGKKRAIQAIADHPGKLAAFRQDYPAWLKNTDREDLHQAPPEAFAAENVDLKDWVPVKLPGEISDPSLPATGAIWLRREVILPAGFSGKPLSVWLEVIRGYESIYWNGKKIGEMTPLTLPGEAVPRSFDTGYSIPADLVKEGSNTIALRIFSPEKPPAFTGYRLSFKAGPVYLEGAWLAKAEFALPPLDTKNAAPAPTPPAVKRPAHYTPGYLFNGMVYPILSYSIRGAIWYQGESNAARAWQYRMAFPLMIADWRAQWKQGDFPFYFCQLANYGAKRTTQAESGWAELREAQSKALALPNTGQAVLIDIGESADIHPRNKQEVGDRLARIALANDYGKTMAFSGPVYEGMKIGNGKISLKFAHTEGVLMAKPLSATFDVNSRRGETAPLVRNSPQSELEGFAICGEDRKWVWADAKIDGDTVVVWSNLISSPIAVRYGWADNPTCNLYNGANLPATPFRTDDFPALTIDSKF